MCPTLHSLHKLGYGPNVHKTSVYLSHLSNIECDTDWLIESPSRYAHFTATSKMVIAVYTLPDLNFEWRYHVCAILVRSGHGWLYSPILLLDWNSFHGLYVTKSRFWHVTPPISIDGAPFQHGWRFSRFIPSGTMFTSLLRSHSKFTPRSRRSQSRNSISGSAWTFSVR